MFPDTTNTRLRRGPPTAAASTGPRTNTAAATQPVHPPIEAMAHQAARAADFEPPLPTLEERRQMLANTRQAIQRLRAFVDASGALRPPPLMLEVTALQRLPQELERLFELETEQARRWPGADRALALGQFVHCRNALQGLQALQRLQTMQGWRGGSTPDPDTDDVIPDAQFHALNRLQTYAAAGPSQRMLADGLIDSWREGMQHVMLPVSAARSLPEPAIILSLAANVSLVEIESLREGELNGSFICSLASFGAAGLHLSGQRLLPARLGQIFMDIFVSASPAIDVPTEPLRQMLQSHPHLRLTVDQSVWSRNPALCEVPGRVDTVVHIDADKALYALERLERWTPGMSPPERHALQDALAEHRGVVLRAMRASESLVAGSGASAAPR